ncbi:MAG: transposase [Proteobacteria bacterium]|nr:transposase [Pseudomonadota bacterium]
MKADRLSDSDFAANSVRLLLHSLAYCLMYALRNRTAAAVPELGRHQFDTLRTRLLKVVVTVRQSVRRIWMQLPAAFPMAVAFHAVLAVGLSP